MHSIFIDAIHRFRRLHIVWLSQTLIACAGNFAVSNSFERCKWINEFCARATNGIFNGRYICKCRWDFLRLRNSFNSNIVIDMIRLFHLKFKKMQTTKLQIHRVYSHHVQLNCKIVDKNTMAICGKCGKMKRNMLWFGWRWWKRKVNHIV